MLKTIVSWMIWGGAGIAAIGNDAELLIHYPLNTPADPVVNAAGKGYPGRPFLLDAPSFVPAVEGRGIRLTGMAEGIRTELADLPATASAVSLYFRPGDLRTRMTLFSFYTAAEQLLALKVEQGKLRAVDWSNPAQRVTKTGGPELKVGVWHHVALVMTGKVWQVWLDGEKIMEFAATATPASARSQFLLLGNDFHPAVHQRDRWVGTLDEFKLFSGVPAEAEWTAAAARLAAAAPEGPADGIYPGAAALRGNARPMVAKLDPATQSFVFDGVSEPVMIYAGGGFLPSAAYALETLPDAAKAGMTVFRTSDAGGRDFCNGNWWYGDDQYDFSVVDRSLDMVFRRNPDAKILLTLTISPPAWWGEKYPDEQVRDAKGRIKHDYFASHSYSSQKWLRDVRKAYAEYFKYLKSTPYYSRIIGFSLVSGRYGECLRAGYNSQLYGKELTDYSSVERDAFQRWLAQRYGTIETMRKAYRTGTVLTSFDRVELPTPAERTRPDSCYFPDPVVDRKNLDHMIFVNEQSARAVCDFTGFIRKFVGPDKIIGLYYGYVFEDAPGHKRTWASDSGHMGLGMVLREAPIDFLIAPVGYTQRQIGSVGPCMGAPASVALHGKLWLDEADIRTSLNGGRAEYSRAANLEESRAILWRTFGNCLVQRSGLWWLPIKGGKSYSDPAIWQDFSRMYQEMRRTAELKPAPRHRNAVALIVDPESIHFRRYTLEDPVLGNLVTNSRDWFAKAGIEYDSYILDDLEKIPDDYAVYFFLNSFYLTDARRAAIARRFKKQNKLLVWSYGSGYYRHAAAADRLRVGTGNIADVTGIAVEWVTKPVRFNARPVPGAPVLTPELKLAKKLNPGFFVTDPEAVALAKFTDEPLLEGKTALAFRQFPEWRSVYLGVPAFDSELIRNLARLGGAHIYSDSPVGPVVRVGNGHILLHSDREVAVKLRLPSPARLTDVGDGAELGYGTAFTVPVGKNRTRLLRFEPEK